MKKLLTALFTLLLTVQKANAVNIDALMDKYIAPVSDKIAEIIFYPIHIGGGEVHFILKELLFGVLNMQ